VRFFSEAFIKVIWLPELCDLSVYHSLGYIMHSIADVRLGVISGAADGVSYYNSMLLTGKR